MKQQPSYYSIITADVRYNKELKPNEKLLYSEITALSNKYGYCTASNNYFAKLYNYKKDTISDWISDLKRCGYLKVIVERDEYKQVKSRKIYPIASRSVIGEVSGKNQIGVSDKNRGGIPEKPEGNNTSINTTRINISNDQPPIPYKEIIDYLNKKTGKHYPYKSSLSHEKIKARWNQGYRLDDFKKVIDVKSAQWKNDAKMNRYLRPKTLFSNKFEDYVQETSTTKPQYQSRYGGKRIEQGTDWSKKKAKTDNNTSDVEVKKFLRDFEQEHGMK